MHRDYIAGVRRVAAALTLGMALIFGLTTVPTGSVLAAGDDSSTTSKSCKKGWVWSNSKNKCVKKSAALDEDLYIQAYSLAKLGHYERAVDLLHAVKNQNDPRVLNYLGYSYRKMGHLEKGIVYYTKALKIDPNFVLAREYLGEGYASDGQIEKAEEQLAEIEKRCGTGCNEYQQLAEVITAARNGETISY